MNTDIQIKEKSIESLIGDVNDLFNWSDRFYLHPGVIILVHEAGHFFSQNEPAFMSWFSLEWVGNLANQKGETIIRFVLSPLAVLCQWPVKNKADHLK